MKPATRRLAESIDALFDDPYRLKTYPKLDAKALRARVVKTFDFNAPKPLEEVTEQVIQLLEEGTAHTTNPRYFGLFCPGVTQASVIADGLVAAYNPQLAAWHHGGAATEMEQHVLGFLARTFGWEGGLHHFTSGGQECNFTATVCALTKHFPGYGEKGLYGLRPVLYLSEEAHHSFVKVAHMVGIGRDAAREIPAGEDLKMDMQALKSHILQDRQAGLHPFMVVGTAGTTSAGIIDPLQEIADFCAAEKLWFHVDGAWGAAAMLAPDTTPWFAGIERADSITCDAHKMLSVPQGAGMFFCKHPEALREAFRVTTAYMPDPGNETVDYYSTSAQWSRRLIGLKLFMTVAELGREGMAAMIRHKIAMGSLMKSLLAEAGFTLVNDTPLPLACFTHPAFEGNAQGFLEQLIKENDLWISATVLRKTVIALRACITHYRTCEADVRFLVERLQASCAKRRNRVI